jgi:hypothetical protein
MAWAIRLPIAAIGPCDQPWAVFPQSLKEAEREQPAGQHGCAVEVEHGRRALPLGGFTQPVAASSRVRRAVTSGASHELNGRTP